MIAPVAISLSYHRKNPHPALIIPEGGSQRERGNASRQKIVRIGVREILPSRRYDETFWKELLGSRKSEAQSLKELGF